MQQGAGFSRRTLLHLLLGCGCAALTRSSAPFPPWHTISTILPGFSRDAVHERRYRLHATVLLLGVPLVSKANIGGAYASVETASAPGYGAIALQFAAGSWPARARDLNRFGIATNRYSGCNEAAGHHLTAAKHLTAEHAAHAGSTNKKRRRASTRSFSPIENSRGALGLHHEVDGRPVYSGSTRKTVAVETGGTFHSGYFFPFAWSTAAFSSGSLTSDKLRSYIRPPIFRRT